jgi:hypothetical protein
MLKNDNEENFKINFDAENRKEWNFLHTKMFWLVHSSCFFAVFTITFLKGPVFGQINTQKPKTLGPAAVEFLLIYLLLHSLLRRIINKLSLGLH